MDVKKGLEEMRDTSEKNGDFNIRTGLMSEIRKYALQNAVLHDGKADAGAVLGKILGVEPELKKDIQQLRKIIEEVVDEVNCSKLEVQKKMLEEIAPELLQKKEKSNELKELEEVDTKKGVVMRFAPSPSGPMHIGHAITGGITSLYVKKYGGKFILRIEDTNSDNIYEPAYNMLVEDANWIFGNVSEVWIQSDRMEIYYKYARKMLEMGALYVCTCPNEEFKRHVENRTECPCRNLPIEEHLRRWEKMLDREHGYREGEAVVRFKSSMQHENPAMRDFPLLRINDSKHPRQGFKYRVWPLMNFSVFVDDVEAGMTHIIRGKDHMDNAKRQAMMYKVLGRKEPKTYFVGRYKFIGLELSCSKTKQRISKGEFSGWDDIRLPFLVALRRRGYQPGAFLKYAQMNGLSEVDKTVAAEEFFKTINKFNKEIIDQIARRYFFVEEPVEITIEGAPNVISHIPKHPDHPEYGVRELESAGRFYISRQDYESLEAGKLYRLMDCLNFRWEGNRFVFISKDVEEYKRDGHGIMHWLPVEANLPKVNVLMPDNTLRTGLGEPSLKSLTVGEVVQFERFGFARLDSIKNGILEFWFAHK
ncbi:MAG: glutamate--tRNA ligase [Candidatus Woesearchaeota archaeon]